MSTKLDIENSNDLSLILDSILSNDGLIKHHIDSMNQFNLVGISQVLTKVFNMNYEITNIRDQTEIDKSIDKYIIQIEISDIELTPSKVYNYMTQKEQLLMPIHAHLNDLTYCSNLYVNAKITATAFYKNGVTEDKVEYIEQHLLAKVPIMVKSKLCNTYNKSREALIALKEDPSDIGGYFIIKGNEYVIDNLESMTYNTPREFKNNHKNELCRSDIISKAGDGFENSSILLTKLLNNFAITFEVSKNKFKNNLPLPFFLLFKACGVESNKEIIKLITYSLDESDPIIKQMLNILEKAFKAKYSDIAYSNNIISQADTLELLSNNLHSNSNRIPVDDINSRKYNISRVLFILDNDFLPHMGMTKEDRYKKARYLGYLLNRLLLAYLDVIPSTDRDSYKNKRINDSGISYSRVLKTQFNFAVVQPLKRYFTKELKSVSFTDINLVHAFKSAIDPAEFERALIHAIVTGDKTITIRRTPVQNRLSSQQLHRKNVINVISTLRNINTTNTSSAKQSSRANEMRRFHSSMIGYICCVQSADTGENVGMQKQMAISVKICNSSSSEVLKNIILKDPELIKLDNNLLNENIFNQNLTKVFVNGEWMGCCIHFDEFVSKYRQYRRQGKIHYMTTVAFDIRTNEISFWADSGRLARPLIIVNNNLTEENYSHSKYEQSIKLKQKHIDMLKRGEIDMDYLIKNEIIEFISPEEHENCYIAKDLDTFRTEINNPLEQFTHVDIPQSIMGLPALISPFANHNQAARVVFETNQVKQTCGWPCLNWMYRAYKDMFIQTYNENPLVKTIANKYAPPMGINCIVAIQLHSGYNQEDSLIINKGAVDRGLFDTYHFTFEKTELEKGEEFKKPDITNTDDYKQYSNYEKLVNGIVPVGTYIEENDIIVGKVAKNSKSDNSQFEFIDRSIVYKKKEPAYVHSVIQGQNSEDNFFCKIVFRKFRKCDFGDKFCLDDTHEVLTTNSWKNISEMTIDDKIAILDNDIIKYENPSEVHEFDHDGELYNVESRQIDITCTLNHKLYIKTQIENNYELVEAGNMANNDYWCKKNGINSNIGIKTFTLEPFMVQNNRYRRFNRPEPIVMDMDKWLILFGIYISEGHIDKKNHVRISAHKQRIKDQLNITLNELNLEFKIYQSEPNYYYITDRRLSQYLQQFGKGINKYLPSFVWQLSQKQSKILLDSMIMGDGHIVGNNMVYYTGSKQLSNDFQKLCIHCGFGSNSRIKRRQGEELEIKGNKAIRNSDQYVISVIQDIKFIEPKITKNKVTIINKNCKVYCPTVSSGIFMIRKNGKAYWTGNSSRSGLVIFGQK